MSLFFLAAATAAQKKPDITEMDLAELAEVEIAVATGSLQPISQAPAVATVVTAEQIENIGATHLDEVLESVPGLHVVPSATNYLSPIYSIRGIHSRTNAPVLTLVNGVPITQLLQGGRVFGFRLPVSNIDRVELIRGPGSAVYGADALAGVINISTKDAADIDGMEAGLRAGSFDRQDVWFQYGGTWKDWGISFGAEWQRSDGDRDRIINEDIQSSFDALFGTEASKTPGPLETRFDVLDIHLGLVHRNWTVHLWQWRSSDRGLGPGPFQALDPRGRLDSDQWLFDVSHRSSPVMGWDLTTRISYLYIEQDSYFPILPSGTIAPVGPDGNFDFSSMHLVQFPQGIIATPGDTEETPMLDFTAISNNISNHRIRIGAGASFQEAQTHESRNFGPGILDGTETVVDGTLTDLTGTPFIYMQNQERTQWYLTFQDEWDLSTNWTLTTGVRYDDYSDFGDTINPRIALVWELKSDLSAKFLYGRAFRAPSFAEQFTINNPINLGNPDLQPEESNTVELAFDYRPDPGFRTALNIFGYEIDGLIDLVPDEDAPSQTAQNVKDQKGYGFEIEADWQASESLRILGNFAWQHAEDRTTNKRVADAPGQQLYLTATWKLGSYWSFNGIINWVADRPRSVDDPRPRIDDYAVLDFTARYHGVRPGWGIALAVRNLLDEKAREPAPAAIPDDYWLEGRSIFVEIRRSLQF